MSPRRVPANIARPIPPRQKDIEGEHNLCQLSGGPPDNDRCCAARLHSGRTSPRQGAERLKPMRPGVERPSNHAGQICANRRRPKKLCHYGWYEPGLYWSLSRAMSNGPNWTWMGEDNQSLARLRLHRPDRQASQYH